MSSRGHARFVAYFDLVMTIIFALIWIGMLTYSCLEPDLDSEKDAIRFLIILGVLMGLYILLSTILNIFLLKATKLGADTITSLKRVKIWLVINIILFVLGVIVGIKELQRGEWISSVITIGVRGPLITLVQRYKTELESHCVDQPSLQLQITSV